LLDDVQIARETCFFTNVYMGLREGKATTGRFPGSHDPPFVHRCQQFFIRQLQVQRPRLILALGTFVPPFLAPLSPQLSGWAKGGTFAELDKADLSMIPEASFAGADHVCALVALTHPSLRPANIHRRRWQSLSGHAAEVQMVRYALSLASRHSH
jgi:uracil-DNA glycosylase